MTAKALQDSGFPTALTDAQATALGLKQYSHGTTYNGGNAPTIAGTNFTTSWGRFIPYQMQDGTWRLRFNFRGDFSVATIDPEVTVAGVTTANLTEQAITAWQLNSAANYTNYAYVVNNSNIFKARWSLAQLSYFVCGDILLASKPTWAY